MPESSTQQPKLDGRRRALRVTERVLDAQEGDWTPVAAAQLVAAGENCVVYGIDIERRQQRRQLVVRLPRERCGDDQPERARRAIAVQRILDGEEVPFRVPRPLGTAETEHGLAVVETRVAGRELGEVAVDKGLEAARITATVAAACHRIDISRVREELDGPDSCRDHARRALRVFDADPAPEIFERARRWCGERLPGEQSVCLLHGDLLAQNILVETTAGNPDVSVVDWEQIGVGDPAFELAAITRGHTTVYGTGETARRLLKLYNRCAPQPIAMRRVEFWEPIVVAKRWRRLVQRRGAEDARTDELLQRIRRLLG